VLDLIEKKGLRSKVCVVCAVFKNRGAGKTESAGRERGDAQRIRQSPFWEPYSPKTPHKRHKHNYSYRKDKKINKKNNNLASRIL
jgi:hypothetical protein